MNRFFVVALLLTTAVSTTLAVPGIAHAQAQQPTTQASADPPKVTWAIHQGVSRPARDLPSPPQPVGSPRIIPSPHLHAFQGNVQTQPDRVRPSSAPRPLVATTSGLNIAGLGSGDYGYSDAWIPPDTNGAVGLTQYVQGVNTSFAVFDKSTGVLLLKRDFYQLWWNVPASPCYTNAIGDQLVRYDTAIAVYNTYKRGPADRWVFAFLAGTSADFQECIAVSTTSDATSTYNRYAFDFGTQLPDYAKLGVWPSAYFISYDLPNGPEACALDRAAMLVNAAATQLCYQLSSPSTLLPADLDGMNGPPAGEPGFFLSLGAYGQSLNLWKLSPNFVFPWYTHLVGPISLAIIPATGACTFASQTACIPQAGTTQRLSALGDRLMSRLAYRHFADGHEALVVNRSIAVELYYPPLRKIPTVGIGWYEIRDPNGTPTVYQEGTFAPDPTYRWMGSMAMDKVGDIALGYSASSAALYPGIRYTGRTPSDPSGTMEAEATIQKGGNFQADYHWGDYSGMSVDPVDGCTFWYTTEYLKSGYSSWSTRIASFKFSGCQ